MESNSLTRDTLNTDSNNNSSTETANKATPSTMSFEEAFISNIKVETLINRDNNELPFGLFNPETEGKLIWMCGEDKDMNITSVYCYDYGDRKEKSCAYLESKDQAVSMRDELMKHGWQKLKQPEITFSMEGSNDGKPLNRKQKRYLAHKLDQTVQKLQKGHRTYNT